MEWRYRWILQYRWILPPSQFLAGYLLWLFFFKMISTSLVTYFLASATTRIQEISETLAVNEVPLYGIASLGFVALLFGLRPWTVISKTDFFDRHRFRTEAFPAWAQGVLVSSAFVLALYLTDLYRFLGTFLQFGDSAIALGNVWLRILTIILLTFCEEYLFRYRLVNLVRGHLSETNSALAISLAYCGVKLFQFDFGLAHFATLFLVSCRLTLQSYRTRRWLEGAGYWAALLIVFHGVFGLPVFGNEFQGLLMMKYMGTGRITAWMTGGIGGPLSSFLFQLLTFMQILRLVTVRFRFRKTASAKNTPKTIGKAV